MIFTRRYFSTSLFFKTSTKDELVKTLIPSNYIKSLTKKGDEYQAELNKGTDIYHCGFHLMNNLNGCQVKTSKDLDYVHDNFMTDKKEVHNDFYIANREHYKGYKVYRKDLLVKAAECMKEKYYESGLILKDYHNGLLLDKSIPTMEELNVNYSVNNTYDELYDTTNYLVHNHCIRLYDFFEKEVGLEGKKLTPIDEEFLKQYTPAFCPTVIGFVYNNYAIKSDWPYLCFNCYGVEVKDGDKLTGGRIYFGSMYPTPRTDELFTKFMNDKGLGEIHKMHMDLDHIAIHMGYDFAKNVLKIYYIVPEDFLPEEHVRKHKKEEKTKYNMRAYSFDYDTNEEKERKSYFCKTVKKEVAEGIELIYAEYHTTVRDFAYQYDLTRNVDADQRHELTRKVRGILSKRGQDFIDWFTKYGLSCDTIGYKDRNNYKIYFE